MRYCMNGNVIGPCPLVSTRPVGLVPRVPPISFEGLGLVLCVPISSLSQRFQHLSNSL